MAGMTESQNPPPPPPALPIFPTLPYLPATLPTLSCPPPALPCEILPCLSPPPTVRLEGESETRNRDELNSLSHFTLGKRAANKPTRFRESKPDNLAEGKASSHGKSGKRALTQEPKPEEKRKRPSSEPGVGSVAGADGEETKKQKGKRKRTEDWNEEHARTSARLLSELHLQIRDPHANFQSMLLEMKVG